MVGVSQAVGSASSVHVRGQKQRQNHNINTSRSETRHRLPSIRLSHAAFELLVYSIRSMDYAIVSLGKSRNLFLNKPLSKSYSPAKLIATNSSSSLCENSARINPAGHRQYHSEKRTTYFYETTNPAASSHAVQTTAAQRRT